MTDANPYDKDALVLRDVADADDARCPDTLDGCLVVSYSVTYTPNATWTELRDVSTRLPTECLVLFDDGSVPVSDLSDDEKAWVRAESAAHSNEVDFAGAEGDETRDAAGGAA